MNALPAPSVEGGNPENPSQVLASVKTATHANMAFIPLSVKRAIVVESSPARMSANEDPLPRALKKGVCDISGTPNGWDAEYRLLLLWIPGF